MIPEDLTAKNQHKAEWVPQQQWHLQNQELFSVNTSAHNKQQQSSTQAP